MPGTIKRQTMKDRINAENAAKGPDAPVAPAIEKSHDGLPDSPEMTVSSKFQFSFREIALIKAVTENYDKQAHQTRRNLVSINVAPLSVDTVRSRCALILEKMEVANDADVVEFNHPLRVTLGDALSLHARKLDRIKDKTLGPALVGTDDILEAEEATRHVANKIGEQLTMHLESEEEE